MGISPLHFIKFKGPFVFFKEIKNGDRLLKEAEEDQIKFKLELNEITRGKPKDLSKDQLDTTKNVKNVYNSRQKIINLFNENAKIRSKAINKTKKDEAEQRVAGLKILTPKQS